MGSKRSWGEVKAPCSLDTLRKIIGCGLNVELLLFLADEPASVTVMSDVIECDMAHASRQLHRLHNFGLVEYVSEKQHHHYRLGKGVQVVRTAETIQVTLEAADGSAVSLRTTLRSRVATLTRNGVHGS